MFTVKCPPNTAARHRTTADRSIPIRWAYLWAYWFLRYRKAVCVRSSSCCLSSPTKRSASSSALIAPRTETLTVALDSPPRTDHQINPAQLLALWTKQLSLWALLVHQLKCFFLKQILELLNLLSCLGLTLRPFQQKDPIFLSWFN